MLEIQNISTGYGKKQVLFDVSLSVKKGESVLLIGSNGSGKSTLLKRIYGLIPCFAGDEGTVSFDGHNVYNVPTHDMVYKGLVYIPQKNNCYESMTVQENMEISALAIKDKLRKQRIEETIEQFDILIPLLQRNAAKLSGGERQLMVLAMAMLHQPKMLLLDEPFAALSGKNIDIVKGQLQKIKVKGVTLLIIEHRIREALPLVDRIYGLKLGRISEVKMTRHEYDHQLFSNILI